MLQYVHKIKHSNAFQREFFSTLTPRAEVEMKWWINFYRRKIMPIQLHNHIKIQ